MALKYRPTNSPHHISSIHPLGYITHRKTDIQMKTKIGEENFMYTKNTYCTFKKL